MPSGASARDRLAFLDVARGLAALLVLVEHTLKRCGPGYDEWALANLALGRIGVALFLVISGFIIPVSLEQGGSNARFWLRRFFRLFPAYWLCIGLAYACFLLGRPVTDVQGADWLVNLTMLQSFFDRPMVSGVFWTLQLELVIYAACSVLFTLRLLSRPATVTAVALVLYGAGTLAGALLHGKPFGLGGKRFLYFAPMVGLVAQHCWAGRLRWSRLAAVLAGQAALVLGAGFYTYVRFPGSDLEWLRQTLFIWTRLLAAHRRPMPGAACWLGRISYSFYLFHMFVVMLLPDLRPAGVFLAVVLALSLLLSELTYRCVELPGIALGRALERRWFPRPAPAAAAEVRHRQAA
jgi:peptidoglycan/LPS O-acetylase OafA/YrhL